MYVLYVCIVCMYVYCLCMYVCIYCMYVYAMYKCMYICMNVYMYGVNCSHRLFSVDP